MTALSAVAAPGDVTAIDTTRTRRWRPWHTGLALLVATGSIVYLWALQAGAYSLYYASIALSMSRNWSNWFFGAVDPAGSVSLDKIPGSYWVPALFVKVFGFSTWSVNAPNAIATVVAVVVVAITARRLAGPTAGLIAGAVAASTPIVAAVARSNQPESFFVLALALVAWASVKALQRGSLGWLVAAGAFIALAFQAYMLEAWAVWPALGAAWLFVRKPLGTRLWQLAVAGLSSLALSLTWIAIVAAVPADARPYVGSTYSNSPWEMVFGYNGLGRFGDTADSSAYRSFTPPFSGDPGLFRLFGTQLAGQIGWLLPAAALAVIVLAVLRFSRPLTILLGAWLATFFAMFSLVAGMHQFYTAALAVPVALLVGTAFGRARSVGAVWAQAALLVAAAATAVAIGMAYPDYLLWAAVVQVVIAGVAIALIALGRTRRALRAAWWVSLIAGAGLVFAPAAWTLDVMNHPNSINPVAGDGSAAMFGGGGGFASAVGADGGGAGALGGFGPGSRSGGPGAGAQTPPRQGGAGFAGGPGAAGQGGAVTGGMSEDVLAYVEEHAAGQRYLMAAFGAQTAAAYITASDGGSVLPVGGFTGGDPVPTLKGFQRMVAAGQLTYVLEGEQPDSRAGGSAAASEQIREWVAENCTPVENLGRLYECSADAAS